MSYVAKYAETAADRAEIDALPGTLLIEFGVDWCPHCQGAQPFIEAALGATPHLRHIKVEDGPGRRLGRTFRVKLWPTLILLRDGQEIGRVVRPTSSAEISDLLAG
ncbi:MAG: thiol reductase thioredoxin [Betaproteobacteria bacterium HGW-Betaproteobacteria-6]|jgi:thioredoxin 1|nr:MAG: thiol reductase thioredoxin [Betaproteobacteria bacterium HGW-Betaproteobacteria-6]